MAKFIFKLMAAVAVMGWAYSAAATSYTWKGSSSGNWNSSSNWTPTGVPTSGDTAIFSSSVTIVDNVSFGSGELIVQRDGEVTFNGVITGKNLTFNGGSSVHLKVDNAITGKLKVLGNSPAASGSNDITESGSVYIYSAGALGNGTTEIDGRTGPRIRVDSSVNHISTPIKFLSNSNGNTGRVDFPTTGDFTFDENVITSGKGIFYGGANQNVIFMKDLDIQNYAFGSGIWHIHGRFGPTGTTYWSPAITAMHLYSSGNGTHMFNVNFPVYLYAEDAIPAHNGGGSYGFSGSKAIYHMNGYHQTMKNHYYVNKADASLGVFSQPSGTSHGFESETAAVVTMAFPNTSDGHAITQPWWGTFYGKAGLCWNPVDVNSTFIFQKTIQPTYGELHVSNGTVRVEASASLPNLSKLVVGPGATFEADATSKGVEATELRVALGGTLKIGTGISFTAKYAWFNNTQLENGTYTSADGYFTGDGTLIVDSRDVNRWVGALTGGDWNEASNWLYKRVPEAGENVRIGGGAEVKLSSSTDRLEELEISEGSTLLVNGWDTMIAANTVIVGGTISQSAANGTSSTANQRIYIECVDLTISSTGSIDVNGKGWAPLNGPGSRTGTDTGYGAAHGGYGSLPRLGHDCSKVVFGKLYDDPYAPSLPGSGGGNTSTASTYGGGAVLIEATGTVRVDGSILASGVDSDYAQKTWSYSVYCGSGGSIWIKCSALEGDGGTIRADGGCGDLVCGYDQLSKCYWGIYTGYPYSNGGGGMIRIEYDPAAEAPAQLVNMVISAQGGHGLGILAANKYDRIGALTPATEDMWRTEADLGTLTFTDDKIVRKTLGKGLSGRLIDFDVYTHNGNLEWYDGHVRFAKEGADVTVTGNLTLSGSGSRLEVGGVEKRTNVWVTADVWGGTKLNRLLVGGDLTITDGAALDIRAAETNATMTWGGEVTVGRDMKVGNGAWVYPWCDIVNFGASHFTVGRDLTVEAGGTISADWRGSRGGWRTVGGAVLYFGFAGPDVDGSNSDGVGASYGGIGGLRVDSCDSKEEVVGRANPQHGNEYCPNRVGYGADSPGYLVGNAGAGLVYVEAGRSIVVDGTITANAQPSVASSNGETGSLYPYQRSGTGSGGGIFLSCATLSGAGKISARGGDATVWQGTGTGSLAGQTIRYYNAAGGGGRVGIEVGRENKARGGAYIHSASGEAPEEPRIQLYYKYTGTYDVGGGTNIWAFSSFYSQGLAVPQDTRTWGTEGTVRFSCYCPKSGFGIIFRP